MVLYFYPEKMLSSLYFSALYNNSFCIQLAVIFYLQRDLYSIHVNTGIFFSSEKSLYGS